MTLKFQKDLNNKSPHEAIDFIQNSSWKLLRQMTIKLKKSKNRQNKQSEKMSLHEQKLDLCIKLEKKF